MTITEALAEIKTLLKRIQSKRQFIQDYLFRMENVKDPLEKDGGSVVAITREVQAIHDLEARIVELRRNIQKANEATKVTIEGEERSIADWITWRREVAPAHQNFLHKLRTALNAVREQARRQGSSVYGPASQAEKPSDVVVNINEQQLAKDAERLESVLGQLDGQLSLKNATIMVA